MYKYLLLFILLIAIPFGCVTDPELPPLPNDIPQDYYRSITGLDDPYAGCVLGGIERMFVVNLLSSDMSVIDLTTYTRTAEIELQGDFSYGVCTNPSSDLVFATSGSYLEVIDPISCEVVHSRNLGNTLYDVVASTDEIFVSVRWESCVYVLNADNYQVTDTVSVGVKPEGLSLSPTNNHLYVANSESNTLSIIDTETKLVIAEIQVGHEPKRVCVSPNGEFIYVTCGMSDEVHQVNSTDFKVDKVIDVGRSPDGLCLIKNGKYLYVACQGDHRVDVIDTSSGIVIGDISNPDQVGMCRMIFSHPNEAEVYVTNENYPNAIDIFI